MLNKTLQDSVPMPMREYEHDEISSSDYGFVTITHPLDNDCNHSAISVLI